MKSANVIAVLLLIIGLGAGFFAGMQYQKNNRGNNLNGQGSRQGQFNQRFGNNAGRPVLGDIISSDDKSITVKLQDGSSKIVILSSSATINKASEGSKSDLKTGVKVAVFGTENSDGTLTATNVQINPMLRMGPQPSGTGSAATK